MPDDIISKMMLDYQRQQALRSAGIPQPPEGVEIAPGLFTTEEAVAGIPGGVAPDVAPPSRTEQIQAKLGLVPPEMDHKSMIHLPAPPSGSIEPGRMREYVDRALPEATIKRDIRQAVHDTAAEEKADAMLQREDVASRMRSRGVPEKDVKEWLRRTKYKARIPSGNMTAEEKRKHRNDEKEKLSERLQKSGRNNVQDAVRNHLIDKLGERYGGSDADFAKAKPDEPFKMSAREERDRDIEKARAVADISEAAVKAGRGMSMAAAGAAKPDFGPEYVADEARIGAAETEDMLTEQERQYIKDTIGVDVPEGMSLSRISATVPRIAAAIGTIRGVANKERGLDLQERRMGDLQEYRGLVQGRVPEPVLKDITAIASTIEKLHIVEDKFNQAADDLGPVWARVASQTRKFGMNSKEAADAQGALLQTFLRYMYGVGGKQLSDKEIDIWQSTMMKATDNEETFRQMLDTFRENLVTEHSMMLTAQARNKRDVEPHLLPTQTLGRTAGDRWQVMHSSAPTERMTKPTGPTAAPAGGTAYRIPASDTAAIEEAKKRGVQFEIVE